MARSSHAPTRVRGLAGLRRGLLALALGTAAGACFNAPSAAVMFACDPAGEAACPSGYTCEADGCCHREGGDVEANAGMCHVNLGGTGAPTSTGMMTEATGSSGATTAGVTSSSDTGTSTGTSTGTGTGTSTGGTTGETSTGGTSTGGTTGETSTGETGSSTGGTTG